jgi:UMF1 family MFS transporter
MTGTSEASPSPLLPATRGKVFAWTLFDFANTAFSVVVVTVIYSRYFTNTVAGGHRWLWGLAVSLSMLCAAALSPPLGAVADYSGKRKRFLLTFTAVSVLCTALLFFVEQHMIVVGITLFILANIGFEGGLVFYDAFLPGITTKSSYGRVSGYGFAMGYLGALAILVLVMVMLPPAEDPQYLFWVRLSFVAAAIFFGLFSIPLFIFVDEPRSPGTRPVSLIRTGFQKASGTFRALFLERRHPSVSRFLVAFFIYNDGILTVIAFAAIFAETTLRMSDTDIIAFFALIQTSAVLGSIVFGIITDKIGPKKTITITLIIWIGISVGAYFVTSVSWFYAVAFIAGIAIGSSQSASRSLMAHLTPPGHETEYFGFYDGLCGKASAVIGPLIYGVIADLAGERLAALCIGLFFLAGVWILQGVQEPDRRERAA